MQVETVFKNVDEIMSLYTSFGHVNQIDEPLSQLEHMCQCAQLAQLNCYDNDLILAAFFHDIGYLVEQVLPSENMTGHGAVHHEKIGAAYLSKKGFSERITKLVASHVQAKRYLAYKKPGYYSQLSPTEKKALEFQGGIMSAESAVQFESDKYFRLYLILRTWDEHAKQEHVPLPDITVYKKKMIEHLLENLYT